MARADTAALLAHHELVVEDLQRAVRNQVESLEWWRGHLAEAQERLLLVKRLVAELEATDGDAGGV